jgi:hypothetical protein
VLQALHKYNLHAHPHKSIFMAPVMEFLGFNVYGVGITPMEAKVAAIKSLKSPTKCQSFTFPVRIPKLLSSVFRKLL